MRVIAENIANAQSTARTPGGEPYRRQTPVFQPREVAGASVRELAIEALKISLEGLRRRARADDCGADERGFLAPPLEIADAGRTAAEHKLALFRGEWNGSVDPLFGQFAY